MAVDQSYSASRIMRGPRAVDKASRRVEICEPSHSNALNLPQVQDPGFEGQGSM